MMTETAGLPTENAARDALLQTACELAARGLSHGSTGNVSMRWDRSGAAGLLITPSALPFDRCTQEDVVWMALAEQRSPPAPRMLSGARRPSSEWRFHHDLYLARPELGAIVHAHAAQAAALSCLPLVQREGLPAFHYMVAAAGGDSIRCAPYATFGTAELSAQVLDAMQDRKACLMAHHGLIASGTDLEAALALATELEWLCAVYARTLALGGPVLLDAAEMLRVRERFADYRP
jgi:L-fuculose-phosphate aldolase